jgi:hypothetical protein
MNRHAAAFPHPQFHVLAAPNRAGHEGGTHEFSPRGCGTDAEAFESKAGGS